MVTWLLDSVAYSKATIQSVWRLRVIVLANAVLSPETTVHREFSMFTSFSFEMKDKSYATVVFPSLSRVYRVMPSMRCRRGEVTSLISKREMFMG